MKWMNDEKGNSEGDGQDRKNPLILEGATRKVLEIFPDIEFTHHNGIFNQMDFRAYFNFSDHEYAFKLKHDRSFLAVSDKSGKVLMRLEGVDRENDRRWDGVISENGSLTESDIATELIKMLRLSFEMNQIDWQAL